MLSALCKHRSIRRYTSTPVSPAVLDKILGAGARGSNTGNMQLYSFVVTQSAEKKKLLAPAHFNQPMIEGAPVVVTVCADINRMNKWCEARNADAGFANSETFISATIDASIAAQNIALAAEEEGLGICFLGTTTYNPDKIIEVLGLPEGVFPITTITIGYPAETPDLTERLPMAAVVHYETYADYDVEAIDRLYSAKEESAANKAFVAENKKQNLAQVFSEVRYPRSSNETFSKILEETLKKQKMI